MVAVVTGHFGEMLQGRLGPAGPLALVTLPVRELWVAAELRRGPFRLHFPDGRRIVSPAQVTALHRRLGWPPPRGVLALRAAMPAGGGAGSSTAGLLAVAAACGRARGREPGGPEQLARLCLAIERATDPIMFPAPDRLLWDPRGARVLGQLPPLPALEVVGGFLGPGQRTDPGDLDFADVADLVGAWVPAAARGDLPALAALATESACRNTARRGGPPLAPLVALARRCGALGVVAAHTGSARGLIFAPGAGDRGEAKSALHALGATGVGLFRLGRTASGR
ncbi:MAG: propanediol utilization protein [Amaricoccus sp.]|uniref:GHMP family kinase ATP-binding protein n=1 Tax=Amaricoccus sp. TaxID=1872485 RepID=UPI0039E58795